VENHSWPKIFDVFALMKTAPHRPPVASGVVMKARFTGSWGIAAAPNLALALTLLATGSALAAQATPEQKKSLHPRRLSPLSRRDPKCAGNYLLPAAAEGQPQRSLPGGVRAVKS